MISLEISDADLKKKMSLVEPVVMRDGHLYYIADVDPRSTAFTRDPKPTSQARGLEECGVVDTYHTWGSYVFFQPSIAEVLAQLSLSRIQRYGVVAFRTEFVGLAQDVRLAGNHQPHHAKTILYKEGG